MDVSMRSLFGKLNPETKSTLSEATNYCGSRNNFSVEIEHYVFKVFDSTTNDAKKILDHFGLNFDRLTKDVQRALDLLKRGTSKGPAMGNSIMKMLTDAWTIGSIDFGAQRIRTGFTILALVSNDDLRREFLELSPEFKKIDPGVLKKEFGLITQGSEESASAGGAPEAAGPGADGVPKGDGKTVNLDQYTINLTARAKSGKIDPVLGRDFEIRQLVDILMRRRQNNPILTGEAGVGKTAVVEGFAIRIAQGDVPEPLKNVQLHSLDLTLLQAGAGVKGEFEQRLKDLLKEVTSSPIPIIVFIDEAHQMIGAGGSAGQGDAANILKPALARGELRTIAATTWSEYKKYFETDAALSRRFQVVKVEEPTEKACMTMLRGVVATLEKHHNVRILDEGVAAAVRLSSRYLAGRQLPDKAVSVMDTACARLALGQSTTPGMLEDTVRHLDDLEIQSRVLTREQAVGADHAERLKELAEETTTTKAKLKALYERFDKEKDLVMRLREIRLRLEDPNRKVELKDDAPETIKSIAAMDPALLRDELLKLEAELSALQGQTPMMRVCVDAQIVGEVIAAWTGIPVGRMLKDEVQTILELEKHLGARVVGQDHALSSIAQRIRTSKARLEDPNKPIGVFMLVGPSGVGKTETALTLAEQLYGGEKNMITINMSEFQEPHTVALLKGAPPGYVGYGTGGVLTEAVRRRPYSVVLLDEVEKAHPDVLELFFQVFDKGRMDDAEGREIDFKNTIIILTSNAATDTMMKLMADPETAPSVEGLINAIKPELNKIFKPAFLGRMVIIPYYALQDEAMRNIIRLKLGKIQRRIRENHKIDLNYNEAVVDAVAKRCTEVESGARNVDNILTNTLLPDVSRQILGQMAEGGQLQSINVTMGENGEFVYQ